MSGRKLSHLSDNYRMNTLDLTDRECRLELMSNEPQKDCSATSDQQSAQVVSGGGFMMIIDCGEHTTNGRAPLWNAVPAIARSLKSRLSLSVSCRS